MLADWLHYIETLHPKTMDLGLARVREVASRLQCLQFSCPIISVAGTNGKGSSVALLAAIYQAAGFKAGTFTSPHILHYNERITIGAQRVTDAALCHVFEEIERARADITLTYFEYTALAAFILLQRAGCDVVILEVGLGGRLDATNIIDADLALITTIDYDHTQWLGDTREAIAKEKAGIFRAGRLAVCGDPLPPSTLISAASALEVRLYAADVDFGYQQLPADWCWWAADKRLSSLPLPKTHCQNAAAVLQVLDLLQERLPVDMVAIRRGLTESAVMGRFQKLLTKVECVVDVAHNPQSVRYLAARLQAQPITGRTLAVVGMLEDKDIAATLAPMRALVSHWQVASLAVARGAKATVLIKSLQHLGALQYCEHQNVSLAYAAALAEAGTNDRVIVFGSFHTVAAVLRLQAQ